MPLTTPQDVLSFWYEELTPQQWFNTFAEVDEAIATRFGQTHTAAIHGELFDGPGMEKNLQSLRSHTKVLERFGRYPHRNEVLGRTSTAEEVEFLKDGRGF